MPASLGQPGLQALNCVALPTWVFSAASGKVLWRNQAAQSWFGQLQASEHSPLMSRVLVEVEMHGGELVLHGKEGQLPGVPVGHPDATSLEFVYSPVELPGPMAEPLTCTLVQIKPQLGGQSQRAEKIKAAFQAPTGSPGSALRGSFGSRLSRDLSRTSSHRNSRHALSYGVLTVPEAMDVVESLLQGRAVNVSNLEALHSMLALGDLVLQPGRISQDLVAQEHLPTDVGLSLMQLLGSTTTTNTPRSPVTEECLLDLGSGDLASPPNSCLQLTPVTTGPSDRPGSATPGSAPRSSACGSSRDCSALLAALPPTSEESEEGSTSPRGDGAIGYVTSLLPALDAVLTTADEWRFDAFRLSEATAGHPLSVLGFYLIKRSGVLDALGLDATSLARFLRHVEDSYPNNPYHSKTHAADVLQSMHVLMMRGGLIRRMGDDTPLIMLAGYLAAIVHDGEHRGLNNDYLVRVGDELALTYNDVSPMENHHVAAAFRLMRRAGLNFVRKLSKERMTRLRRLLIDMVLATDMKSHFKILSLFQAKLQVKLRNSTLHSSSRQHSECGGPCAFDDFSGVIEDESDRSLVLQVALKCADVGHLAAPWEVHHRWVTCLEEEFFRQGDREKAAHITVSPLMDRCKDGITKSQVGFFDIVALPLFCSWASVFPDSAPLVRAVEDNCSKWRQTELGRTSRS